LRAVFSQTRNFTVIAFTDANTRFRWPNAMVKSAGSGPKGLTLHLPLLS